MILWLHRLRRDEEGQTLVLGAVFGIILALCVLGTVNLGRAVYEKIQLQTACDNGAYSQAAVEARVLNLTAYTNRAMVVHYSSIMAAQAYLTWIHFTDVWVHAAFQVLSWIPYIGEVFTVINEVISVIIEIMDVAVTAMTPIVSAANVVLYSLQEGAWWALYLNRLAQTPPEAHSGDSGTAAYQPIWSSVIPAANQAVFSQTRGSLSMLTNTAQAAEILLNLGSGNAVEEARLHMLEIANSAREPWVAYGDRYTNPSASPLARHWAWSADIFGCRLSFGVNARSELGGGAPLTLFGIENTFGETYAGSRLQFSYACGILGSGFLSLFSMTTLDQLIPIGAQSNYTSGGFSGGGLLGDILRAIVPTSLFSGMVTYAKENVPVNPDYRATWISPYVYFSPSTQSGPAGGVTAVAKGLGNFGQPDVIFGLARQRTDFNQSNPAPSVSKFGGIIAGLGGEVDFTYTGNDWPSVPGLPGTLQLQQGFNAICAAQAYYHRPGDWQEMPNFFNPLWAARLMPVLESNAAAALGATSVPVLQNALYH